MEVRYPVSLNPSATIFVLGFAEGGNNFSSLQEYNPFTLYKSREWVHVFSCQHLG
jgi:outer membrane protein insertion porin family